MAYEEVIGSRIISKIQCFVTMCHLHTLLCVDKSPSDQHNTSSQPYPQIWQLTIMPDMPDMTDTHANSKLRAKLTELLGKREQEEKSQVPKSARPSLSGQASDNVGPSVAVESEDEQDVPPVDRRGQPRSGFQGSVPSLYPGLLWQAQRIRAHVSQMIRTAIRKPSERKGRAHKRSRRFSVRAYGAEERLGLARR